MAARGEHLTPGEPRVLSKKEEWLREKALRPDVHVSDADLARWSTPSRAARARRLAQPANAPQSDPELWPGERIEPVTTLYNIWTHEALPILPGEGHEIDNRFRFFLRDHFTNQATHMDTAPHRRAEARGGEVLGAADRGRLRLSLAEVQPHAAQEGAPGRAPQPAHGGTRRRLPHPRRRDAPGAPLRKSLRMGGVGFYPHSQFVHSDTGPIRYWTGS